MEDGKWKMENEELFSIFHFPSSVKLNYFTPITSTIKIKVVFGGIPPLPFSP